METHLPPPGIENALVHWLVENGTPPYQFKRAHLISGKLHCDVYNPDGRRETDTATGEDLTMPVEMCQVRSATEALDELHRLALLQLADALELLSLLRDIKEHGIEAE